MMNWMSKPGPEKRVSDLELLKAMERWMKLTDEPVVRAGEVSILVELGKQQCRDRLKKMAREGLVDYKQSGSGKVWWIS